MSGILEERFCVFRSFSPDERINGWPLMRAVLPTMVMGVLYIFAIFLGRKWMENRKAFELRYFMFIYNFLQVIVCAYITYEV